MKKNNIDLSVVFSSLFVFGVVLYTRSKDGDFFSLFLIALSFLVLVGSIKCFLR